MQRSEQRSAWLESERGQIIPLHGNCRLGRAPDNQLVIEGPKASRYHAAIHAQDENEFWLMDLGSRNGTYLNEHRVIRPTRLRDGARILLAGATFHFRQTAQDSSDQAGAGTTTNATITEFKDQDAWLLMTDIECFTQLSQDWPPERLAIAVGGWFQQGQQLVEKRGGRISKYLGDGFLACWESTAETVVALADALHDFHALRETGAVKFRVVLHYGCVTFGGPTLFGEESMIGPELNYIFRLEDLASELGVAFCLSAAAQALLAGNFATKPIAGEHELKGFTGRHRCFAIDWS